MPLVLRVQQKHNTTTLDTAMCVMYLTPYYWFCGHYSKTTEGLVPCDPDDEETCVQQTRYTEYVRAREPCPSCLGDGSWRKTKSAGYVRGLEASPEPVDFKFP